MIAAIPTLSIGGIRKLLLAGEVSVTEVVRSLLERIEALNPKLNAFITVLAESALADA
ncbi:MAG: amidase, partial [Syntrophobacteraceae bacterium CG07_land_8_20_14_0_80_61_8]